MVAAAVRDDSRPILTKKSNTPKEELEKPEQESPDSNPQRPTTIRALILLPVSLDDELTALLSIAFLASLNELFSSSSIASFHCRQPPLCLWGLILSPQLPLLLRRGPRTSEHRIVQHLSVHALHAYGGLDLRCQFSCFSNSID